ncbi:DDE_3 domain-containing protein [Trichonephila clavipes]|nr:DDE_3 domain-containing protein [Trichonephila clavipes]
MGAEFLLMDDNTRPHRANIVDECLQSEDITRMDWPAYSPDLNPIEHVWDMLDRRIAARQPSPTCLPELRRALLDEWCNIPQDQIDSLILSMPRRPPNPVRASCTISSPCTSLRRKFIKCSNERVFCVDSWFQLLSQASSVSSGRQLSTNGIMKSPYFSSVLPKLSKARSFPSTSSYRCVRSVLDHPFTAFFITSPRRSLT